MPKNDAEARLARGEEIAAFVLRWLELKGEIPVLSAAERVEFVDAHKENR